MKQIRLLLLLTGCFVCGLVIPLFAQSKLPERDTTTVGDLFERLGRCSSSLSDEQKYEEKLAARIRELEKTVAFLQATNAELAKTPAEKK